MGTRRRVERKLKLIAGSACPELAQMIADQHSVSLCKRTLERFADGECRVKVLENVRGQDVYIIQSTCYPVNENIMELLLIIDTLKRASANRICAVIPYYGYARQDKKVAPREPISAKLVASLLETAGVDRVIAIDLHSIAIQGFFDLPVDNLTAKGLLCEEMYNMQLVTPDSIIVSPDVGGVARASAIAERVKLPLAIISKRRPEPNQSHVQEVIGSVEGKIAIMVDDMIDTAGSVCGGAKALKERGAKDIYVFATHPVLSGLAVERILESDITTIVATDTIPLNERSKVLVDCNKLRIVSTASLLAEAIRRAFNEESISVLFD